MHSLLTMTNLTRIMKSNLLASDNDILSAENSTQCASYWCRLVGRSLLVVASVALLASVPAEGASATWSGSGGNSNWSTGGNWSPATAPGSTSITTDTSTATFSASTGTGTTTVNIDSTTQNIGSLGFTFTGATSANYAIGTSANAGNSLLLSSGGQIQLSDNGTGTVTGTVNAPLVLEAASGLTTGSYTFTNTASETHTGLNIAGNISAASSSAYTLTLSGSNTVNSTDTISGSISDGTATSGLTVVKAASSADATWVLSGANTYSGGTIINSGTITISADDNLGAAAGAVTLAGGDLSVNNEGNTVTLNSSREIILGNASGSVTTGTLTAAAGSGTVTPGGPTRVANASTTVVVAGNIVNGGASANDSLTLAAAGGSNGNIGIFSLTGANNTYSGGTTIGINALAVVTGDSNFGATSGTLSISSGGGLGASQNASLSSGRSIVAGGNLLFYILNGVTLTIGDSISGSGVNLGWGGSGTTFLGSAPGSGVLQLTGNNTFSGTINLGGVSGPGASIDVDGNSHALGSATLVLSSMSSTSVSFQNSSTTAVTLANNVTFKMGGNTIYDIAGPGNITFTGTATGVGSNGSTGDSEIIDYTGGGTLTFSGTGTFGVASFTGGVNTNTFTLESTAANNIVISDNVVDESAAGTTTTLLRSLGTTGSTLTLSGNNSYTGGSNFQGGTIILSGNNNTPGGTSVGGNNTPATLDINNTNALGTGTLFLSNAVTIDNTSTSPITIANNITLQGSTGNGIVFGDTNGLSTTGTVTTGAAYTTGTFTLDGTKSSFSFGAFVNGNTSATPSFSYAVNGVGNTLNLGPLTLSSTTTNATGTITGNANVVIGSITNGASSASNFTYAGSGTATLSGTDSYGGTTSINSGTVIISGSNSTTGVVGVGNGTLDINNNNALGTSLLSLNSGATIDDTGSSADTLANNVSLNGTTNSNLTFGGTNNISTTGTLTTATGYTTGTITLKGTGSTLAFGSMVNGNTGTTPSFTIAVNGTGNTLSLGALSLSSTGTVATDTFGGNADVSIGAISNGAASSGNFTYAGSGTATLSGNNTLSGTLKVNSGKVILSGDNSSETGTVALVGGELDLNSAHALSNTTINNFGSAGSSGTVTLDNTSNAAVTETLNPNITMNANVNFNGTQNLNLGTGTVTLAETSSNNGLGITFNGTNSTLTVGTFVLGTTASTTAGLNVNNNGTNNTLAITTLNLESSTVARAASIGGSGGANVTVGSMTGGATGDSFSYNGDGVFTLTGAATYQGGTTINNGLFYLGSGATMAAPVSATATNVLINNGGSLGGLGTVSGNVLLDLNGTINLVDGKIGTLTLGALSTTGGGVMSFEIGTGSTGTDKIALGTTGNTFSVTGETLINVDNLDNAATESISTGTYTLITYHGTQQSLSEFIFDSGTGTTTLDGDTLTLSQTGDVLSLVVTGASTTFYYTGAGGTDFSTGSNYSVGIDGGTAQSGTLSSTSDVFISANTHGSSGPLVNTATTIDSLTFNSNGAGATVGGTAPLTVEGTNNSGVGVADNAGGTSTETISAPVVLGADQSWNVSGQNNTLAVTNSISGSHNLTLGGSGTFRFAGANSYNNTTVTTGAKLLLANGTSGSATGAGAFVLNSGATLGGYSATPVTTPTVVGTSSTSSFTINGNVIVGTGSDTVSKLDLIASGSGVFSGANLTFNLATTGGASNVLELGATAVNFATTTLTLNLVGSNIVAPNSSYTLITDSNGFANPSADGLQVSTTIVPGETVITGGLTFANNAFFSSTGSGLSGGFYDGSYLFINGDSIDVEVVPEPSTWALIVGGLGLLIFIQRARRKNLGCK